MAKNQAPTPKQSFMNTLLMVIVMFLGFYLISNAFRQPPDSRTPDQALQAIQALNQTPTADAAGKATQELDKYKKLLQGAGLAEEERLRREVEAAILVGDLQHRAGLATKGIGALNTAYHTLQPYNKRFAGNALWSETNFPVDADAGDNTFGGREVKGSDLYNNVVRDLSERNRNDLVWGFFPGYQMIDAMVTMTGSVPAFSYMFAALILALIVRAMIFPLAQKQIMHGRQMAQLIPLINEIKEKCKDDPQEMQIRTMGLYKEYGINPMAGCFPVLLQMPLFFLVYQCMLHYQFEFQKGVFLWINPQTSIASNGFIAPNLGQQDYILLVVYGISMIVTTLLMPVSDPTNARQGRIMGIGMSVLFSVMMFFWPLPSAFVLYWIFTNILSTLQSLRAYRLPLPPLTKVNTPAGGVYPGNPFMGTNGSTNGHAPKTNGQVKTGKPVKHKPKKRK
jgi:YidC/Oxa1 family membrane protein insertase